MIKKDEFIKTESLAQNENGKTGASEETKNSGRVSGETTVAADGTGDVSKGGADDHIERCERLHTHRKVVETVRKMMPCEDVLCDVAELFKVFGDSTRTN